MEELRDATSERPGALGRVKQLARWLLTHRWRIVRGCAALFLAVIVIGAALTYRWFIAPSTSVPQRADAVAVLAGGDGERLDRALGLMELGVSEVLILNEGVDWFGPESQPTHDLCRTGSSDFEVVCVRALPDSTRGEAITLAELARQRGYSSLVLVTTDHHLTRSARWLRRCFDGTVHAVAAPAETTRDVIQHEWLSTLAQYTFDRSCEAGDATEF